MVKPEVLLPRRFEGTTACVWDSMLDPLYPPYPTYEVTATHEFINDSPVGVELDAVDGTFAASVSLGSVGD